MFESLMEPHKLFGRGVRKFKAQDFRGALADVDLAINRGFRFSHAVSTRASCRVMLQDYEAALSDCQLALELSIIASPCDVFGAYGTMAMIFNKLGQKDRALWASGCIVDFQAFIKCTDTIFPARWVEECLKESDFISNFAKNIQNSRRQR